MSMRKIQDVYLADTARVMGEVELGAEVNVWYAAAVRGDVAKITIGAGTNVQDNAVVHCDSGVPNAIGRDVTIGHAAIVHGKSVGDGSLIGMHATVLGESVIGRGCLVAAGAVVPPGMVVPEGMLVIGVPGKAARPLREKEVAYLKWLPEHYRELAQQYVAKPEDPRFRPWGAGDG